MSTTKTKVEFMNRFVKADVSEGQLVQWFEAGMNVLLIGEKGVGKTQRIMECFERMIKSKKWAMFSGATMDPWTDLIGIPKIKDQDGKWIIEYVRPELIDDDIEAFFIDEYNRSAPKVKNALMELMQHRSINGRKFPKLKVVWGAINPPPTEDDDEEDIYSVHQIDPAQMDRFHVHVILPNEPSRKYFHSRFGYKGGAIVDWWKKQPDVAKKHMSSRRLEYVLNAFDKKVDVKFLLPSMANATELVKLLQKDPKQAELEKLLAHPSITQEAIKKFVGKDSAVWNRFKETIMGNLAARLVLYGAIPDEDYATALTTHPIFLTEQSDLYYQTDNALLKKTLDNIRKTNRELDHKLTLKGKRKNMPPKAPAAPSAPTTIFPLERLVSADYRYQIRVKNQWNSSDTATREKFLKDANRLIPENASLSHEDCSKLIVFYQTMLSSSHRSTLLRNSPALKKMETMLKGTASGNNEQALRSVIVQAQRKHPSVFGSPEIPHETWMSM